MTNDEIKNLLRSGDVAGAEAAAQELLATEPDNVQAMMLYGTCRQLQGDEATFRRIHDELAPKIATVVDGETQGLWRKYSGQIRLLQGPELVQTMDYCEAGAALMEYVVIGLLIVSAVGLAVYFFGRSASSCFLYSCAPIIGTDSQAVQRPDKDESATLSLYRGPSRTELHKVDAEWTDKSEADLN